MDPITAAGAVEAIRHAVQDHGGEGTIIGQPGDPERAQWFAGLLGMTLPPSYLQIVAKHDGVCIDEPLYPVMESLELFSIYRDTWCKPRLYWPVGGDGCGNSYVLVTSDLKPDGEAPVAFLESGSPDPTYWVASSHAHFVYFLMTEQCARKGCGALVRWPRAQAWPFDPEFVLAHDPGLARLQPRDRWPV